MRFPTMAIAKAAPATLENEPEEFLPELPPLCEKCLAVGNLEDMVNQLEDEGFKLSRT